MKTKTKLFTWAVALALTVLGMGCNGTAEKPAAGDAATGEPQEEVFPYESEMGGPWRLISCTKGKESVMVDCDKSAVWTFTEEQSEPLADGTEVFRLVVSSLVGDCDDSVFEAKWRDMRDGKVFISKAKVGGFGGLSMSGMMEVMELGADRMELMVQDVYFVFER